MGLNFGKLLKVAAPMAANYFLPGSGALVSGLMGGASTKKNAKQTFDDIQKAGQIDQQNAQGDTSVWSTDPATGQRVQTQKYGAERQKQSDLFNQMATGRMQMAAGLDPTGKSYEADYEKMGLGALLGGASGTTGKRPWADDKYSSLGGDMLKNLQYSGPTGPAASYMTQTWGSGPSPQGGAPQQAGSSAGGGFLSGLANQLGQNQTRQIPGGGSAGGGLIGSLIGSASPDEVEKLKRMIPSTPSDGARY